jgi:Flp pilus assembly protein TadG
MNIGRNSGERGASAVEMALVAPFLILILLGIIEFGYLFGEYNEVRHAAREGARFAAVSNVALDMDADTDIDETDVILAICGAIDLTGATIDIALDRSGDAIGDEATVGITANVNSLSGAPIISGFLPDSLANEAVFRLEQPATWAATKVSDAC